MESEDGRYQQSTSFAICIRSHASSSCRLITADKLVVFGVAPLQGTPLTEPLSPLEDPLIASLIRLFDDTICNYALERNA